MVFYLIYIVYSLAFGAVESVQLDDDTLGGQAAHSGTDATCSGKVDVSLGADLFHGAGFDDGPIDLSQVTLAYLSGHVAQIEV